MADGFMRADPVLLVPSGLPAPGHPGWPRKLDPRHRLSTKLVTLSTGAAPSIVDANSPPSVYRLLDTPPRMVFNVPDTYQLKPDELQMLERVQGMVAPGLEDFHRSVPPGTIAVANLNGPTRRKLLEDPNNEAGVPQFDFLMTIKATFEHLDTMEKLLGDSRVESARAHRYIPTPEYTHKAVRDWIWARAPGEARLAYFSPRTSRTAYNWVAATRIDALPGAGAALANKTDFHRFEEGRVMHMFPAYYHIDALSQGLYRLFTANVFQFRDLWSNQDLSTRPLGQFATSWHGIDVANVLPGTARHLTAFRTFAHTAFSANPAAASYGVAAVNVNANAINPARAALNGPAPANLVVRMVEPSLWPRHGGPVVSLRAVDRATVVANAGAGMQHPNELRDAQEFARSFFNIVKRSGLVRYLLKRFDVIVQAFYNSTSANGSDLAAMDMLRDGRFSESRLVRSCGPGARLVYLDRDGKDLSHKAAVSTVNGREVLNPAVKGSRCDADGGSDSGVFGAFRKRARASRTVVMRRMAALRPRRAFMAALAAYRGSKRKKRRRRSVAVSGRKSRKGRKSHSKSHKSRKGRKKRSKSRKSRKGRKKRSKSRKGRKSRRGRKGRSGRKSRKGHVALSRKAFAKCKRLLKREVRRGGRKSRRGRRKARKAGRSRSRKS
jgi:hypothetical protein